LKFRGATKALDQVLLDTGSAGTIFSANQVADIGILPEPQDHLRRKIGALSYGFPLHGILGLDFLWKARAIVDLDRFEVRASSAVE